MSNCHSCSGPMRITVIETPRPVDDGLHMLLDPGWSAVRHCRDHPEHDLGEPYLGAVTRQKSYLSEMDWLWADDPIPSEPPDREPWGPSFVKRLGRWVQRTSQ